MTIDRRRLSLGIAAAGFAAMATPLAAQQRVTRLIVPAAPGGAIDVIGRLYAQRLSELLGQTWVVENKSGGSNTVGAAEAAPTVLLPPDLFSTTQVCPSSSDRRCAYSRPITSIAPPAEAGTISRTARCWAASGVATAVKPAAAIPNDRRRRSIIIVSSLRPPFAAALFHASKPLG